MFVNFWGCGFSEADEINNGTDAEPDYEWGYACRRPENETKVCILDNQWGDELEDCRFLDISEGRK